MDSPSQLYRRIDPRRLRHIALAAWLVPFVACAWAFAQATVVPGKGFEDYPTDPTRIVADGPLAQVLTPYSALLEGQGFYDRRGRLPVQPVSFEAHRGRWIVMVAVRMGATEHERNHQLRTKNMHEKSVRYYADLQRRLDQHHPDAELWVVRVNMPAAEENPLGSWSASCTTYYSAGCADRLVAGFMDQTSAALGTQGFIDWLAAMHNVDAEGLGAYTPTTMVAPYFSVIGPDGAFYPMTGADGDLHAQNPAPQPMVLVRHLSRLRLGAGEEVAVPDFPAPRSPMARKYGDLPWDTSANKENL